jgi:hypothetical protein
MCVCLSVLLCIRTVDILEPNRLHIRNQHDQEEQHWLFIFQKKGNFFFNFSKMEAAIRGFEPTKVWAIFISEKNLKIF